VNKIKIICILLSVLLLTSCGQRPEKYSVTGANDTTDSVSDNATDDIAMDSDANNITLIQDNNDVQEVQQDMVKFQPEKSFSDFAVTELYSGPIHAINYNSNPIALEYETLITGKYKTQSLNFAGHYCFISWMCGSACHQSAIVDLQTGMVYSGIVALTGFGFQKDSRMVIVNLPDANGCYDAALPYGKPYLCVWNEEKKMLEEL